MPRGYNMEDSPEKKTRSSLTPPLKNCRNRIYHPLLNKNCSGYDTGMDGRMFTVCVDLSAHIIIYTVKKYHIEIPRDFDRRLFPIESLPVAPVTPAYHKAAVVHVT